MVEEILTGAFCYLVRALNSPFAIGLLSALAGAFAGALGAQRIAERSKSKADLLKELRNTNAAITLAVTICNAALALKKQHVTPMSAEYAKQKQDALAAMDVAARGEGPSFYHLTADLKLFPVPETPIDSIKSILFNNISVHGRALALLVVLDQSIAGLKDAFLLRKDLAAQLHAIDKDDLAFYELYLGLKTTAGHTNELYPDTVGAIVSYTDDIAFFAALLTDDLIKHGQKIHQKLKTAFKTSSPKVSTVDFTRPRALGLIPPESQYTDWLQGFTEQEKSK